MGGSYTLPQATESTLGGVQGATAQQAIAANGTNILGWSVNRVRQAIAAALPTATNAEAQSNSGSVRRIWTVNRLRALVTAALPTVGQAEAEAGTAATRRAWTAERVAQAIAAQAGTTPGGGSLTAEQEHDLEAIPALLDKTVDLAVEVTARAWGNVNLTIDGGFTSHVARPTAVSDVSGLTYHEYQPNASGHEATGYTIIRIPLARDSRDYRVSQVGSLGTFYISSWRSLGADATWAYHFAHQNIFNGYAVRLQYDAITATQTHFRGETDAPNVEVDTTGFSGNLSAADDTVAKALATLDSLSAGAGPPGPTGAYSPERVFNGRITETGSYSLDTFIGTGLILEDGAHYLFSGNDTTNPFNIPATHITPDWVTNVKTNHPSTVGNGASDGRSITQVVHDHDGAVQLVLNFGVTAAGELVVALDRTLHFFDAQVWKLTTDAPAGNGSGPGPWAVLAMSTDMWGNNGGVDLVATGWEAVTDLRFTYLRGDTDELTTLLTIDVASIVRERTYTGFTRIGGAQSWWRITIDATGDTFELRFQRTQPIANEPMLMIEGR